MNRLTRERYAHLYGPTTGDRIRLADTDLLVEITEDRSGGPGLAGDEAVFGGGKVLRESMGQGRATRAEGAPDTVITGAVIVDYWGIIKADIGIRDGRIVAIGKAGNPDIMAGVHPDLVVGPSTEVLSGNGRIVTAGTIDCHVHLICPQVITEAIGVGTTAIVGGMLAIGDGSPPLPNGTVLFRNGRIVAAGSGVEIPAGATVIDAHGKWVAAGIVAGFTDISIAEIMVAREGNDTRAPKSPFSAGLDISSAINPRSAVLGLVSRTRSIVPRVWRSVWTVRASRFCCT